jgi:hypothetical protein
MMRFVYGEYGDLIGDNGINGDTGDKGGESNNDYYPTIDMLFIGLFFSLNYFLASWDLWNIGENYGDKILISYLDLFATSF